MFLMTKLWVLLHKFPRLQICNSYFNELYFMDTIADEKRGGGEGCSRYFVMFLSFSVLTGRIKQWSIVLTILAAYGHLS